MNAQPRQRIFQAVIGNNYTISATTLEEAELKLDHYLDDLANCPTCDPKEACGCVEASDLTTNWLIYE